MTWGHLQWRIKYFASIDYLFSDVRRHVAALEQADLMRVAWHLSEVFYWSAPSSSSSSTVQALHLSTWARTSLDPFSMDDSHSDPTSIEYFWSYIRRLLIRGELAEAATLLASNASHVDSRTVAALLRKKPLLPTSGNCSRNSSNNLLILFRRANF